MEHIAEVLGPQWSFGIVEKLGVIFWHVYKKGSQQLQANYLNDLALEPVSIWGVENNSRPLMTAIAFNPAIESGDSGAGMFTMVDSQTYFAGILQGNRIPIRNNYGVVYDVGHSSVGNKYAMAFTPYLPQSSI